MANITAKGSKRLMSKLATAERKERILLLIAILLFSYALVRAHQIPFVHDESFTYLNAVKAPISDVLSLSFKDANNHPLNTWGMFLFSTIFGESELALRAPNLLAHLVYLFASFSLVRKLPSAMLAIAAFLVLNLNPFQLEFFALARGYGLGSGFLMLSIWLAVESIEAHRQLRAFVFGAIAMAAGTLAAMANYSFIYFYLSLPIGLLIGRVWRLRKGNRQVPEVIRPKIATYLLLAFAIWNSLLTLLIVGREIISLRRVGAFYVGGKDGLWQDTFRSLIDVSVGKMIIAKADWVGNAIEVGLALLLLLSVLLVVRVLVGRGDSRSRIAMAAMVPIFYCSVVLVQFASIVLDVNYPQDRSAIFLVPLIGISAIFVLTELSYLEFRGARRLSNLIAGLVAAILSANFLLTVNISTTTVWSYDADVKRMLEDLEREKNDLERSRTISLGINWWFEPSINFYRVTRGLAWLEEVNREGLEGDYDYYYFHPGSLDLMVDRGVDIIHEYEITGNRLGKPE